MQGWKLGDCEVLADTRQVRRAGAVVPLGSRAFDLLLALLQHPRQVLAKDELLAAAWPGVVVEENNLSVQVSVLRKHLGRDVVVTVPGRGYQLGLPAQPLAATPTAPAATAPPPDDLPSLAVLPFEDRSEAGQHALFCDAVTEDLITELSRFRALRVVSRASSFAWRGRSADVREVGRDLEVRYVLTGSVRRDPARVRVSAHLAETAAAREVWSERFDCPLAELFERQEALIQAIATAAGAQVDVQERARSRRAPRDLTAYDIALRGWALLRDPYGGDGPVRRDQARILARQALAIDPGSSLAIRTMAWADFTELWLEDTPAHRAAAEQSVALTSRLIAADNGDHAAFHYRGLLQMMLRRPLEAVADLRRACELNPNDLSTLAYLGYALALAGEPAQGRACAERAVQAGSRDPQRYLLLGQLAWCCVAMRDWAAAATSARACLAEAPWFPGPMTSLCLAEAAQGHWPAAAEAARKLHDTAPALLRSRLLGRWMGLDEAFNREAQALLVRACREAGLP